jgi:hypothetical protein
MDTSFVTVQYVGILKTRVRNSDAVISLDVQWQARRQPVGFPGASMDIFARYERIWKLGVWLQVSARSDTSPDHILCLMKTYPIVLTRKSLYRSSARGLHVGVTRWP